MRWLGFSPSTLSGFVSWVGGAGLGGLEEPKVTLSAQMTPGAWMTPLGSQKHTDPRGSVSKWRTFRLSAGVYRKAEGN